MILRDQEIPEEIEFGLIYIRNGIHFQKGIISWWNPVITNEGNEVGTC